MKIKIKKIILIILFIVALSEMRAQEVDFGLKAGMYFSSFSLANNIIRNSKLSVRGSFNDSFGVNGIVKLKSDDNWEIWLEPGFVKKGGAIIFTYHNESASRPIESYCRTEYSDIELPLLLQLHLKNDFYYCFGIGLGYTLSTEHRMPWISNSPGNNLLPDLDKKLNNSIIAGLNYNLSDYYALSLRYSVGLTKVTTKDLVAESYYQFPYTAVQTSIYNNSLQLSLIYSFNL